MAHLREHWQGVSLPGGFVLQQYLGDDDDAAFFQTSLPADGRRAVVKLVPDSSPQLDLWRRTRQLHHPNLLELLDCGRAEHAAEVALFAVFESPDDTLATALGNAPLTPQEAREVLDSVLAALRYLHSQGLALGPLDPDHILAVGDAVKLSSDAIHQGPASDDILALGVLWQQSLLRAYPSSADIAAHAADPNPQTRWTLSQIEAALKLPLLPPPPPRPDPQPVAPYKFPKWIFAGVAALLLLILAFNLHRSPEVAVTPATTVYPVPAAKNPEPVDRTPPPSSSDVWRVIAFTYHTRDGAAQKAKQINRLHPDLHATVISSGKHDYLVALGGPMSHADALRLQHSARGKGIPRDIYVQNFPASVPSP